MSLLKLKNRIATVLSTQRLTHAVPMLVALVFLMSPLTTAAAALLPASIPNHSSAT